MRKFIILFSMIAGLCVFASAQTAEIAVTAGAKLSQSFRNSGGTSQTDIDPSFTFGASLAAKIVGNSGLALQVVVPFTAVPSSHLNSDNLFTAKSYSAYYVTPGLRLKLAPDGVISPWIDAGVGIVHFGPSSTNLGNVPSGFSSTTKMAFTAGAGVDLRPSHSPIGFRAAIHEFYTGRPDFVPRFNVHNNVIVDGGIVFRF
jgi:opacity protein-like surface antigen